MALNRLRIDGHNRFEICKKHNIPFGIKGQSFDNRNDVSIWIIKNQLGRCNLVPFMRLELVDKLKGYLTDKGIDNKSKAANQTNSTKLKTELNNFVKALSPTLDNACLESVDIEDSKPIKIDPIDTLKEIAKIAGTSRATAAKANKIIEKAPDGVKQKLRSGDMSINQAYKEVKREEKRDDIKTFEPMKLTTGTYNVILIDPPWRYDFAETKNREIENQYPTMDIEDLKALEVPVNEDTVLFLWATAPK